MLIPIAYFYSIFVQFMQFPVLDFGLGHSGSQPFNYSDSAHGAIMSSTDVRCTHNHIIVAEIHGNIKRVISNTTRTVHARSVTYVHVTTLYMIAWLWYRIP